MVRSLWRWVAGVFFLLLSLAFLAWCAAAAQIVSFARKSATGPADAALVLGAAAWGYHPSPVYRERIVQAIQLYDRGQVHWIILTGGSPRFDQPSEAEVGRRFCLLHGIPDSSLVEEDVSRSTWQNLQRAHEEMKTRSIRTVLLVSDPLHMKRAVVMARAQGINAQPAPTATSRYRSWRSRAAFLWRETWLYMGFVLFGIDG